MKLSKIHKILEFKQSDWLIFFFILTQTKEQKQVIILKEIFLKLMINSVFGKTMENLRKRICVELFNNAKDYVRCVSRPSSVSWKIFSKTFAAVHEIKPVLILNKAIYVKF